MINLRDRYVAMSASFAPPSPIFGHGKWPRDRNVFNEVYLIRTARLESKQTNKQTNKQKQETVLDCVP